MLTSVIYENRIRPTNFIQPHEGIENYLLGWTWWLTPVILALWDAEVGGSQGQEFKTSLATMVKPRLY